jgi:hypothetical protein
MSNELLEGLHRVLDGDNDGAIMDDVGSTLLKGYYTAGGAAVGGGLGLLAAPIAGPAAPLLGAAAGGFLGNVGSGLLAPVAEEAGDFLEDALGTRRRAPYGHAESSDKTYKQAERPPTMGERVRPQVNQARRQIGRGLEQARRGAPPLLDQGRRALSNVWDWMTD